MTTLPPYVISQPAVSYRNVSIEKLIVNPDQPRRFFDPEKLHTLADTLKKVGLIEPIIVCQDGPHHYRVIAGERRWRAAQLAGLATVPCLVRQYTAEQRAQVTLIENLCREALNPIEAAQGIKQLIDGFHYTHQEVADIVGIDRTAVTNSLRLLMLDPRVQELIKAQTLSESHGRTLAGVALYQQAALAQHCVTQGWAVQRLETEIKSLSLKKATPKVEVNHTYLERQLSDQLGCPVKVKKRAHKGYQLAIDCVDLDQMQSILEKLGYQDS